MNEIFRKEYQSIREEKLITFQTSYHNGLQTYLPRYIANGSYHNGLQTYLRRYIANRSSYNHSFAVK